MSDCEKCQQFDESTLAHTLLGIPCDLCKSCYRSWVRRYHKNPKTTRFEVLTERMNFLRATSIGRPLATTTTTHPVNPYEKLDVLVEEREACELILIEDTIDWLEEKL